MQCCVNITDYRMSAVRFIYSGSLSSPTTVVATIPRAIRLCGLGCPRSPVAIRNCTPRTTSGVSMGGA